MKMGIFLTAIFYSVVSFGCEGEKLLAWVATASGTVDASTQFSMNNLRFKAVDGYVRSYPGVSSEQYEKYKVNHNPSVIEGTSDVLCSEKHMELNDKAYKYAEEYNIQLIKLINGKEL